MNDSNRIVLRASSNFPTASFFWNTSSFFPLDETTLEKGPEGPLLILRKDTLSYWNSITIGVTVKYVMTVHFVTFSVGASRAYSQVLLTIAPSPTGGNMIVSPWSGTALDTIFCFNATGWSSPGYEPLSYR